MTRRRKRNEKPTGHPFYVKDIANTHDTGYNVTETYDIVLQDRSLAEWPWRYHTSYEAYGMPDVLQNYRIVFAEKKEKGY